MQKLVETFLDLLGVRVENASDQAHSITGCIIGEIFNSDVAHHERDHDMAMRGGPIIANNKHALGYCDG